MAINAEDVLQVTIYGSFTGQADEMLNVWYLQHQGDTNLAASVVIDGIDDWLTDVYNDITSELSDDFTWERFKVYNMTQDAPIVEQALSSTVTGGSTQAPLANQLCALVSFSTARKKTKGRKYIPGFTVEDETDSNTFDSAATAALETLGATAVAGFTVASQDFVPGAYRPDTAIFSRFTEAVARSGIYTQRRRRLGVGT